MVEHKRKLNMDVWSLPSCPCRTGWQWLWYSLLSLCGRQRAPTRGGSSPAKPSGCLWVWTEGLQREVLNYWTKKLTHCKNLLKCPLGIRSMISCGERDSALKWSLDNGRVHTFGGVVHEEALKQLVLDGDLFCWVVGQDVFMAHVVQTWEEQHGGLIINTSSSRSTQRFWRN